MGIVVFSIRGMVFINSHLQYHNPKPSSFGLPLLPPLGFPVAPREGALLRLSFHLLGCRKGCKHFWLVVLEES